jgi:hypothetical protein
MAGAVVEMSAARRRKLFDVPLHANRDRIDVRDVAIAEAFRVALTVVCPLAHQFLLFSQVGGGRGGKGREGDAQGDADLHSQSALEHKHILSACETFAYFNFT